MRPAEIRCRAPRQRRVEFFGQQCRGLVLKLVDLPAGWGALRVLEVGEEPAPGTLLAFCRQCGAAHEIAPPSSLRIDRAA